MMATTEDRFIAKAIVCGMENAAKVVEGYEIGDERGHFAPSKDAPELAKFIRKLAAQHAERYGMTLEEALKRERRT